MATVDDFVFAGTKEFDEIMENFWQAFVFGDTERAFDKIQYVGLTMQQDPNTFEVNLDLEKYVSTHIQEVQVSEGEDTDKATPETVTTCVCRASFTISRTRRKAQARDSGC